ncbi:MAG: Asp-tRNA(Asn)/Glu-tRNA(Gln) amidotransferase subunit GatB [Candidatus Obscuribacter sp.]|nr:Asp-tRNA(Asn)/Glu-tRNA(Gln) amidotransferase subunit GatB [Candidatus Obscuribacter sp.]MBK9277918.1 Asp-tRNA(Asn)/Glu-tRNA(Gln) amidotransferase subunit GatB [Candidatus Obscuribacter sp.]
MALEAVIGLEVHAQLKTNTKIFCSCPTAFAASENEQVCPVCLGMPGVLPVLNKKAVEFGIRTGLALNSKIAETCRFDRKNYFYADLPKGYQISQYEKPICLGGYIEVNGRKVQIHRAHLEEDAGKLVHAGAAGLHGSDYSKVDFNRSSMPLLEIVSEPDLTSPEEARLYLTELRNILRYIEVCDGNLEEGSFRCDANVSLRPVGQQELGTKTEIKNMNSFRAVQRAIQSEIERQTALIEKGERIVQETRLWNEAEGKTHPMRSKEEAHDYRYFPEPDLMPLTISRQWVEEVRKSLPELPAQRRQRYQSDLGLSSEDAAVLTETKELSDFFESSLALNAPAKAVANWLIGPATAYLKENKKEFCQTALTPQNMADLCQAVSSGKVSSTIAKQLLLDLMTEGGDVAKLIESKGLAQVSDEGPIKAILQEVLDKSPNQLADYASGKVKLRQYFFGEAMKALKGKANPQVINKLLDEMLPPVAAG